LLRDACRLIDQDQWVAAVDALETRLIVVTGLATISYKFFAYLPLWYTAHVDLTIEVEGAVQALDFSPQDSTNLW
jgi:hypothetical protein